MLRTFSLFSVRTSDANVGYPLTKIKNSLSRSFLHIVNGPYKVVHVTICPVFQSCVRLSATVPIVFRFHPEWIFWGSMLLITALIWFPMIT